MFSFFLLFFRVCCFFFRSVNAGTDSGARLPCRVFDAMLICCDLLMINCRVSWGPADDGRVAIGLQLGPAGFFVRLKL